MKRALGFLAAVALWLPAVAWAQQNVGGPPILQWGGMTPTASNAVPPDARNNLGLGIPVSVIDKGAKHNALVYSDGVVSAASNSFCSNSATFSAADVGKLIQIDGAGAGVTAAPLATTIAAYVSTHCVTLGSPASTAAPLSYFAYATIATDGSAGSYIPGETIPLSGGTSTTAAAGTVQTTHVRTAVVNAGGSGGTAGAGCIVQTTTNTGTPAQLSVTISGGAIASIDSIPATGHFFTNPTSLSAEPVANAPTSSCAPTGATVTLTMGVDAVYVQTAGVYSVIPSNPVATGAGSSSGATGATLTVTWSQTGGFVYGTDDSAALASAINQALTNWAAGSPAYVFMPAGNYLIDGQATPLMTTSIGVVGEGARRTNLIVGASYSGDLFSWSEAWAGTSNPLNGAMAQVNTNTTGPRAVGFSVYGNRRAASQQNALVFYDRNDQVVVNDIDVYYLNGRCLYSGVLKNKTQAYMRESSHLGQLRCFGDGQPNVPVVEFSSEGVGADGSNEINIGEIDIFSPYGPGFVIRNHNAGGVRDFRIGKLRIEGLQQNAANIAADLLVIGDATWTGQVNDIYIGQLTLLDPYTGRAALRVTAPNSTVAPYEVSVEQGLISGGAPLGFGVAIDAGRNLSFKFSSINTWNTNFSLSSIAGRWIGLDGGGQERSWSYSLDSTTRQNLITPARKSGLPSSNSTVSALSIVANAPDSTLLGGNTRGSGAVDLQTIRTLAAQVASGFYATIGGGRLNTASGTGTAIPGGSRGTDRGLKGGMFYSPDACQFSLISGACQRGWFVFGNNTTSTSATRLTSDAAAAGSTNCLNIAASTAYHIGVKVIATDRTNHDMAAWNVLQGMLTRGTGNAAYAGQGTSATTPDNSVGGGSTATIQLSADTSNQCLNITWVAPNTDQWDVTAVVDTAEVQ